MPELSFVDEDRADRGYARTLGTTVDDVRSDRYPTKGATVSDAAARALAAYDDDTRYFEAGMAALETAMATGSKAAGEAAFQRSVRIGPDDEPWARAMLDEARMLRHKETRGALASKAFIHWIRTGRPYLEDGTDPDRKAGIVLDATGMALVPVDIAVEALAIARQGVFRSLASVRPTNRAKHRAGLLTAATVGWGRVEAGGTLVDANTVPENPPQEVEVFDLLAEVKIGTDELDDSVDAARAAVIEAVGNAIRDAEDVAFAVGSGTDRPRGIVAAANLARIPAANKIAASASNTPTWPQVTSLPGLIADRYRDNATWVMHPASATKIAALAEAGSGTFEPGPRGRGLYGWPVRLLSALPDPATAGTTDASILFGDFSAAYRIANRDAGRITVRVLRETHAVDGIVGFICKIRVGGDLVRPAAVAVYTQ